METGAGSGLLILILEKFSWFHLSGLITLVLLMWKWICLFLRKNYLIRYWGCLSLLNWIEALTLTLLVKLRLNRYKGLLMLQMLPCSNSWLIIFSLSITLVYAHLKCLNWFHFPILMGGLDCMIYCHPFLDVTSMFMSTVFSLSHS